MALDLALTDDIFLTTEFDCAMQELDLMFNTENTELLGYTEYGVNMEQFLWDMNPSENEVKTYIYEKIDQTYFVSKYLEDIEVQWMEGTYRGMYFITFKMKDPNAAQTNQESQRQKVYQYR